MTRRPGKKDKKVSKMTNEPESFSQARGNLDASPQHHKEIITCNFVIPTQSMSPKPDNFSETPEVRTENSSKQKIDQEKDDKLTNYLEQMAQKRGELSAILAGPKWALLPIKRVQTTRFAEDDESKSLGNTLEDFFNTALKTPTLVIEGDNEPTWKKKARLAQIAREKMAAWKAGKAWQGMAVTPTKQPKDKTAEVAPAPTPATTSLDDLRTLMDIIAQAPEQSFDDTFKPTITRALNDKAVLEVIFSSTAAIERFNELNTAVPVVPLSISSFITGQSLTLTQQSIVTVPASHPECIEEILDESSTTLIPELPSPESELEDVFSPLPPSAEPTQAALSEGSLPSYQEGADITAAVDVKVLPQAAELDKVRKDNHQVTQAAEVVAASYASAASEDALISPSVVNGSTSWNNSRLRVEGVLEPAPTENMLQDSSTTTRMATISESDSAIEAPSHKLCRTVFTTRYPTLEEILQSLVDPSCSAAILKACGAVTTESVPDTQLALTSPPMNEFETAESLSSHATARKTEADESVLAYGSAMQVSETSLKIIIGILVMHTTSDDAVLELFNEEDQAKIVRFSKWKKIHKVVRFKTIEDRDAAFAHLPDELKLGTGADQTRLFAKIFEHHLYALSSAESTVGSEASVEEVIKTNLEEFTSRIALATAAQLEFIRFGKLPEKLRKKIWTHARPERRMIKLRVSASAKYIYSTAPVPALLHACRESRIVALGWYQLAFSSLQFREPKVYFDFSCDGIYTRCRGCLGPDCLHKKTCTKDHEKVRLLAYEAPMSFKPFKKIAKSYPGVEELILIKGKSTIPRGEISLMEFERISERFSWQGYENDLVALYLQQWKEKEAFPAKESQLRRITRMALPGLLETPDSSSSSSTGSGMWTCCM